MLHSSNLNSWFIADDPQVIYCSQKPFLKLLFDKETYYHFNTFFYSPLLPFYLKNDFLFFKLKPLGYHIHSVIALFMVSIIIYKVFSLYIERLYAFLGSVIFSVLPSTTFDSGWITTRHYLWGMFFYITSIWLFKRWEDNKKNLYVVLSVFLGMLAFLSKELFVSLPAVILILSKGGFKYRVKKTVPFIAALLIYLLWRFHMLEGMGGYPGEFPSIQKSLMNVLKLFPNISKISLSLSILAIGIILLSFIKPTVAIAAFVVFLVTIVPLIQVLPSNPETHPFFLRGLILPSIPLVFSFIYLIKLSVDKGNYFKGNWFIRIGATSLIMTLMFLQITESRRVVDYLKGVADETEKAYSTINSFKEPVLIIRNEGDFLNLPMHYFHFLRMINDEYLKVDFTHATTMDNRIIENFIPDYLEITNYRNAFIYRNGVLEAVDMEKLTYQKEEFYQSLEHPPPGAEIDVSGHHIKVKIDKQCTYKTQNLVCIKLYGDNTGCFYLPDNFSITLPPGHYVMTIFLQM